MSGQVTSIDLAHRASERARPTRLSSTLFLLKANILRAQRALIDWKDGPKTLARGDERDFPVEVAVSSTPLWPDPNPREAALQRGKVHNLRVAAKKLDRLVLAPDAVFSFWKALGPPFRARGFVTGRMLKEGCLVPATGGGLCQLSNALYDVAMRADCTIVERHAHSRVLGPAANTVRRDATVAWNYVDLRFASRRALLVRVELTKDRLTVRLLSRERGEAFTSGAQIQERTFLRQVAQSCATCGEADCYQHEAGARRKDSRVAFLVDEYWPEYDAFVSKERTAQDVFCVPIEGRFWRRPQYGWATEGFRRIVTAPLTTLKRSLKVRKLAAQGGLRQTTFLNTADALAARYGRSLKEDVTELCVAQTLLPCLAREGHLGGRRYRVLMTRFPMTALQERLDQGAALHPDCKSLADFRAPPMLVASEAAALDGALQIITPHTEIAALFGPRAVLLDWKMPKVPKVARRPERMIAFPGPTVGRKGAFELREAARRLDLEVLLQGSDLEGVDFWQGFRVRREMPEDWMSRVAAMVQPAFLEDQPRRLLHALASGVPVITTPACGIPAQEGLTLVPPGDVDALAAAIEALLPSA